MTQYFPKHAIAELERRLKREDALHDINTHLAWLAEPRPGGPALREQVEKALAEATTRLLEL
jgi:hypothetical protein